MDNNGECIVVNQITRDLDWSYGAISGGTPPLKINNDEYITFFHSYTASQRDTHTDPRQYYIGAYTFKAEPPFNINRITSEPLSWDGLLTSVSPTNPSRVLFPAGLINEDGTLVLTYGENDNWNYALKVPLTSVLKEMTHL